MPGKTTVVALVLLAFVSGYFAGASTHTLSAQQSNVRFHQAGTDGPFRIWKDVRTGQCFIVTAPYNAMLMVGPC